MKVRGERECRACGTRWSYYEVGSVACPTCGSLRSVGVDDRRVHTDVPIELDLATHRDRFGEARGTLPEEGVDALKADLREYVRRRGFIRGGRLLPLDATYLAARELLETVDAYDRLVDPGDTDREHLLTLLRGAEIGDRPAAADVLPALYDARGMAAVRAVEEYRDDLLRFLDELASGEDGDDSDGSAAGDDERPTVTVDGSDPAARIAPARETLERLRDRTKRIEALGGAVDPDASDALVAVADAVGEHVRTGDAGSLENARERLFEAEL